MIIRYLSKLAVKNETRTPKRVNYCPPSQRHDKSGKLLTKEETTIDESAPKSNDKSIELKLCSFQDKRMNDSGYELYQTIDENSETRRENMVF